MSPIRVCFVCLGNICRSPTAHAVFEHLVTQSGLRDHFAIDSAGTGDWHVGQPPHVHTCEIAQRHGIALNHRAQHFTAAHFDRYDYILAMDQQNRRDLARLTKDPSALAKVQLFRAFDPLVDQKELANSNLDVPDPYNRAMAVYADVFALCQRTCANLLAELCQRHHLRPAAPHGGQAPDPPAPPAR